MYFDRQVSAALLTALKPNGALRPLVDRVLADRTRIDLQLRKAAGPNSEATIYAGLTSVLHVHERGDKVWLTAHPTHAKEGGFDPSWRTPIPIAETAKYAAAYVKYLDALLDDGIDRRWTDREGAVSASLSSGGSAGYQLLQREAQMGFASKAECKQIVDEVATQIRTDLSNGGRTDPWWPGVRDHGKFPEMGTKVDALAVDPSGRLLVIEAKPAPALKGLVWAPAQVRLYVKLFAELAGDSGPVFTRSLQAMLQQRVDLGLSQPMPITEPLRIAPVIAVGPGSVSPSACQRMAAVAKAVDATANSMIDPLEVWFLDGDGHPAAVWKPVTESVPEGAGKPATPGIGGDPPA